MPSGKTDLLYIGGYNRSGSTLLLRLLSGVEGYHSVGELWILDNAVRKNPLCGCGTPFNQCEFWVPVIDRAFGGFRHVDIDRMSRVRRSLRQARHILPLVVPALRTADYTQQLSEYTDFLSTLYGAIREVAGGKIIIDSSKSATYAFVLAEVQNINLNIVHLVRDSRAIAYSWQRRKIRPEYHWGTEYMEQKGPIKCSFAYFRPNMLLPLIKSRNVRYMRMRYEDLVRDPRRELGRIGRLMEDREDKYDILSADNRFVLGVDHTVAGNPMRFQRGILEVSPDDEWRIKMAQLDRYVVTALTWPLLSVYGYLGRDFGHTPDP